MPFWIDFDLSAATVIYALALAVLGAVIMGVLPGLKATGRSLTVHLHELNGPSAARVGAVWTTLIVAQLAVAVGILPGAVYMAWEVVRMELAGPGVAAEKFVVGTVVLSGDTSPVDSNRIRARHLELVSRLQAEPGVAAVTYSSRVPGYAPGRQIEFEQGIAVQASGSLAVSPLDVGVDLFEVYDVQLLAGRAFTAADLGAAAAVVVNRTFAEEFLGERSPLGVRFRYARPRRTDRSERPLEPPGVDADAQWYHVVGVVADFPRLARLDVHGEPAVYHPAGPGAVHPLALSIRFSGSIPDRFIDRFREIGAAIDPAMQLRRVMRLSDFYGQVRSFWRYLAWGIGLLTASVLLLSAAGIYAMLSFTVAQRTREIGIRAALGAAPSRLLLSIVGRVTRQLGLGLLAGSLLSAALLSTIDLSFAYATRLLLTVAAIMAIVGLLAALGPARRGSRIQASEALRVDG